MHLQLWLCLTLLFSVPAIAFYPYTVVEAVPDTVEPNALTGTPGILHDKSSDGNDLAARETHGGAPTLKMTRRAVPPNVQPHIWSVLERQAVAQRSHASCRVQNAQLSASHGTPIKRANNYRIVTASQPSQSNSMAVDEDGKDFSYFSAVKFGSSGETMYMLVDTGAANTWVMGSDCTTPTCLAHNTFGDASSDTLQITKDSFNLTYGTGSVNGVIVNDSVAFAGFTIPLAFGSASNTSSDFMTNPMDGILGLGRSNSNTMGVPTVMEAISNAKLLTANIFGVNLQRNSDGSTDGEVNFGAPDRSKYAEALSYINTVADGRMWEIPIDDASINGVRCNFTGRTAILDTGTSFILMPPGDAQLLNAQIPQSQQNGAVSNIPCSSSIPVQLIFSGVTYDISPKDYVGNPVQGGSLCHSNIIGQQAFGADQWLLGDVFLKNVYAVFDFDKKRIGLGNKIIQPNAPASSTPSMSTPSLASSAASSLSSAVSASITGSSSTPSALISASEISASAASPVTSSISNSVSITSHGSATLSSTTKPQQGLGSSVGSTSPSIYWLYLAMSPVLIYL